MTILITGATSGIGKVSAEIFARNGYDVNINDITVTPSAQANAYLVRRKNS